ncbi:hypothetical protein FHS57_002109 [Runella defluvii]|uniref:Uncharacterized protein n=1 Tax=Runella defluvii TaxID=370973 RepID=A0A7W5ZJM0_9BACT|nr:hypothetical protein [Runella defluvii]
MSHFAGCGTAFNCEICLLLTSVSEGASTEIESPYLLLQRSYIFVESVNHIQNKASHLHKLCSLKQILMMPK